MRKFFPLDLGGYPNILSYLQRVAQREPYQRAMQRGDPDLDIHDGLKAAPPVRFTGYKG